MITTCSKCGKLYEERSEEEANAPGRLCLECFREDQGVGEALDFAARGFVDGIERGLAAQDSRDVVVSGLVEVPLAPGERLAPGALDVSGLISETQAREVLATFDAGGIVHETMLRAACAKVGRESPPPAGGMLSPEQAAAFGANASPWIEPDGTWSMRLRLLEDGKVEGSVADERREAAAAWIGFVDRCLAEGEPVTAGVPVESLADWIRNEGFLDETPALALLDEIAKLRRMLLAAERRDRVLEAVEAALASGADVTEVFEGLGEAGLPQVASAVAKALEGDGLGLPVAVEIDGVVVARRREIVRGPNVGAWIVIFEDPALSAEVVAKVDAIMRKLEEDRNGGAREVPFEGPVSAEVSTDLQEGTANFRLVFSADGVRAEPVENNAGPCPVCGKPLRALREGGVECSDPLCDEKIPF